jgi:hypothetical protein
MGKYGEMQYRMEVSAYALPVESRENRKEKNDDEMVGSEKCDGKYRRCSPFCSSRAHLVDSLHHQKPVGDERFV